MRRAASFLACGIALLAGAQVASANFVVTANKVAGTGQLAGYDIWQLFVTNNGQNGTQDDVQAWDLTATTPDNAPAGLQPFWFWRASTASTGAVSPTGAAIFNTADAVGTDYFDAANSTGSSSNTINKGNGSFLGLLGDAVDITTGQPSNRYAPNGGYVKSGTTSPAPQTNANYAATKTFRVAASLSYVDAGAPNDRLKGTVRFGNIIVPTGNTFSITGQFLPNAGLQGNAANYAVAFTNAVPEPASLGLIGLATLALGRRRRA